MRLILCIAIALTCGCQKSKVNSIVSGNSEDVQVLIFTSTDCPIANALVPEFKRLKEEVVAEGGSITFVHTWENRTQVELDKHSEEYDFRPHNIVDRRHELVNRFDVTVTPEVVVILFDKLSNPKVVYQGKVNNLFDSPGNRRDRATEHYAREAIHAAFQGQIVTPQYRKPTGCLIEVNHD